MKNQLLAAFSIAVLLNVSALKTKAQSRAACVPKNGYWVLISNKNVKNITTVQFYNTANQIIYEEEVRNQKMNINRLNTLRSLKRGLDSALVAWNLQKQALYNKNWIAANLKQ